LVIQQSIKIKDTTISEIKFYYKDYCYFFVYFLTKKHKLDFLLRLKDKKKIYEHNTVEQLKIAT